MPDPGSVLCVANYRSNTGYAWDFIERLYARIADDLARDGVVTYVAYPSIGDAPGTLVGSAAKAVALDAALRDWHSIRSTIRFVRSHRVRVLYLTDRPAWSFRYVLLRGAGVRWIVVHRHNAGGRHATTGIRRIAKAALARLPGVASDVVVAVSDYVARMQRATTAIPNRRIVRVWNGMAVPHSNTFAPNLREEFGLDGCTVIFACACRAVPLKGVAVLMRAFDRVSRCWPDGNGRPGLLYVGDGPQFQELSALRATLPAQAQIAMAGFRRDVERLLLGADVCVVASTGPDALPLSVLQPMALGKPVIGSAIGGIPEMIVDGVTGFLVPPGDEEQLAKAMLRLGTDPPLARDLGSRARERVIQYFSPDEHIRRLITFVRAGLGLQGREGASHPNHAS
jgi:glycosyltransferase involved in cell wall biosynthesis